MPLHVAFLRGVGGPKPAPRDELVRCFGGAGYDRVTPVIATGNVVFGMGRKRKAPEAAAISAMLERHFGYPLPAILRTGEAVAAMVAGKPFGEVDPAGFTRFIAMLAENAPPADALAEPGRDAGYRVVARRDRDLFLVIDREGQKTPEVMRQLDRAFGKAVTTRNWSTMERVAAVLAAG